MYDTVTEKFASFLKQRGGAVRLSGDSSSREQTASGTIGRTTYVLSMEHPILPCLFVFDADTGVRDLARCLNPSVSPATKIIADEYYKLIEALSDDELDQARYDNRFDDWTVPIVEHYIERLADSIPGPGAP
jgi:hypothetical protein